MVGRPARLPQFVRFHDLSATHAMLLLDRGAPLLIVAERIGDDPNSVSAVIGALALVS
jgi:hypothetical protein